MKQKPCLPSLPQLLVALSSFLFLTFSFTTWLDLPVPLALFAGWFILLALGLWLGNDYASLESAARKSICHGLGALLVLLAVGALIGSWISGGIVPAIIYYGLKLIHPTYFLLIALIICSLTSLATGTSWGAAATTGIAMMSIGKSLSIPAPLIAGAVLSGVYFGDKLSPLSDSVILAATMAKVEVVRHIKNMLLIALISYIITACLFTLAGFHYAQKVDLTQVTEVTQTLVSRFQITPLAFIPVAIVLLLLSKRQPAFLVISLGALLGVIWTLLMQQGTIRIALQALYRPQVIQTQIELIDNLLAGGGLFSMLESVIIIILGLGFGGLLEKIGALTVISQRLEPWITHPSRLTLATLITAFFGNLFGSAMYVSLILTPTIMLSHYDRLKISRYDLSRNAEFGGTLTCAMIPWSDNGIFMSQLLGVSTFAYLPYLWLTLVCITITLITAYSGKFIHSNVADESTMISE
ncbi:MAG: Na+/H+ antiporter NhaC [Candidatus Symbiodolus clandestinus]